MVHIKNITLILLLVISQIALGLGLGNLSKLKDLDNIKSSINMIVFGLLILILMITIFK